MLFYYLLESSIENQDTESSFKTSAATNSDSNNADSEDLMPPPKEKNEGTRKKQKLNAVDKQIVDILQKNLDARQRIEAESLTKEENDKLFCL